MLTVELLNRTKRPVTAPIQLVVSRYATDIIGGPVDATLTATGARTAIENLRGMLGYFVRIRNRNNVAVWWGIIEEVTTDIGGIAIGVSLRDMRNRIKVNYAVRDGDGRAVALATDWSQHDQSVAIYGRRELYYSAGETTPDGADGVASRELERLALPRPTLNLSGNANNSATIRCVGLWSTLAWTYYENLAGREAFDVNPNTEQVIGWGFTAGDVGFADRALHRMAGGLDGPAEDDVIRVSGSTSNNGAFTVAGNAEGDVTSYTATTIAFDPADDINDSTNKGLGFIRRGTFIQVIGSTANSGYHLIDGSGREHVTTDETVTGAITLETAGPSITIAQGQSLPLAEDVIIEIPGASGTVTVNSYTKLAYSFTLTENLTAWTAAELWLRVRRIGAPTDSLLVALCADASGAPGTILDFNTIAGSALLKTSAWVKFELANTDSLSYGTTYWVQAYRTGVNDPANYYAIGVDEDLQRGAGTLKLFDGSAWVSRAVDADVPFQVWGAVDTTDQIDAMLTSEAQLFDGHDVRVASALPRRQYRAGANDALYEIEKLLDEGASGVALVATVNQDWHAIIDTINTDSADYSVVLRRGPELVTPQGRALEEGLLPVGQWCAVDGINDGATGIAPLSPILISYLEYDATTGKISDLQAWGADAIFAIGVEQG